MPSLIKHECQEISSQPEKPPLDTLTHTITIYITIFAYFSIGVVSVLMQEGAFYNAIDTIYAVKSNNLKYFVFYIMQCIFYFYALLILHRTNNKYTNRIPQLFINKHSYVLGFTGWGFSLLLIFIIITYQINTLKYSIVEIYTYFSMCMLISIGMALLFKKMYMKHYVIQALAGPFLMLYLSLFMCSALHITAHIFSAYLQYVWTLE
ncbi:uncharacterized protein NEPG_01312 [Nematocida parisii ERTm1]|uniref:Uncharacterized protein n=1 Tax=Nematocida parisii (strain ERTm3) TaxID=935791 RepID=I3EG46_NEMP3|nr:uncharacterized protein NEPG_01312 [Nematocida parisii ERTm1]EIJ88193.1 hypothetical protein NEQG_01637 [Nematocida parisii ERTm3]KAI5125331.1 hypothetical protein NEPAR03_0006 [Nematocida parisii]EIJ93740.1 hypothetical protein NEPG_01312 [Nematocida parisii ERTm1]KAI5125455.1 hypothetical protein NEPAR08_0006 [Nematocida parisii]KAI5140663.1 hypothetical protein NEPAR04_0404 [Nematocida parisii]|eukprot:XP_013059140.1 hypothetical protein NEPG_01312 [Nematocida parisii ERTm1]